MHAAARWEKAGARMHGPWGQGPVHTKRFTYLADDMLVGDIIFVPGVGVVVVKASKGQGSGHWRRQHSLSAGVVEVAGGRGVANARLCGWVGCSCGPRASKLLARAKADCKPKFKNKCVGI